MTGGANGIGAACVAQLRDAGARVAVLDLADASGADESLEVDVADEAGVVAAIADVERRFGGLDVAILSAGVGGSMPLLDLTTREWDRVVGVNLRGAFVCLRESARAMAANAPASGGAIVAITSISGFLSERLMAHYAVSKAGLAQLVRSAVASWVRSGSA